MTSIDNRTRNQIMVVLFIGVLMGALDIAIVVPALPAIQAAFHVGDRALVWMFSLYVLFNLIGTPLMAKLSDQYGRKWVYIADVLLFAAGSLWVALSQSFTSVLIGRAIQGFGAGGIFPVASAVIGDVFPAEKRGSALGLIGAVFGLAFIVGPILGGVLLLAGWQWLFIVNLPIAAVVIVMGLRFLPASRPDRVLVFDWPGMWVLASLLACLAFGINPIDTAHFLTSLGSSMVWPFLVTSAILVGLFTQIEVRSTNPIVRLDLFKNRQMALTYALSAGAGLGESGLVFMPALAVASLGVAKSSASFLLMPVVLAMAVGSPTVGRMLDKMGSRIIILGGTVLLTVGMAVLGLFSSNMALFITAGILIGLGLSALLGAPTRFIMLNEAAPKDRSVAQGVVSLFGSVGQLMSSALVGAVAASQANPVTGYSSAYLVICGVSAVLVAVAFGLKGRTQEFSHRVNETAPIVTD